MARGVQLQTLRLRIAYKTEYLEVQMEMNNMKYCKYNKRDPQTSLCKLW